MQPLIYSQSHWFFASLTTTTTNSGTMVGTTTPPQAWAILSRHARDDIAPLRLKDLCTDNDRITSLVTVHSGSQDAIHRFVTSAKQNANNNGSTGYYVKNRTLIADLSRQRLTLETLNYLLRLATAVDVRGFISTLAWGQNDRFDPITAVSSKSNNPTPQKHFFGEGYGQNSRSMPFHHVSNGYHDDTTSHYTNNNSRDYMNGLSQRPLSPSRSVASSHVKKTRFAQSSSDNDQYHQNSDDVSTVHSTHNTPINHPPSSSSSPTSPHHVSSPIHKMPLRTSPSMHMALRAPSNCGLHMLTSNGANALDDVHSQWKRIQLVSSSIRKGQIKGVSGHMLTNILVIGRGVTCAGVQFMYEALKHDEMGYEGLCSNLSDRKGSHPRSMRFLSSYDPITIHSVLTDWNPEKTCVVSIILSEEDGDLLQLTQVVKTWLMNGLKTNMKRKEMILGKHVLFVTASDGLYHSQSITKTECTFLIPSFARCEAFTTLSVAGLLPLSIAFGWGVVQEILNGAHDLDTHFVETNPRHNLPVLLALVDLWNDYFLPMSCSHKPCGGKMITPFMDSFQYYPTFVATLESQVCGRPNHGGRTRNPYANVSPSGLVVDGGLCGSFDRVVYQGRRAPQCELVMAMEPQLPTRNMEKEMKRFHYESVYGSNNVQSNQDRSICSFFAHADVMAFGCGGYRSRDGRGGSSVHTGGGSSAYFGHGLGSASFDDSFVMSTPQSSVENDVASGNRPSSLLLCSRCDPFTIGQLIALSEHRAIITAKLWDVEHYAFGHSNGSNIRSKQVDEMSEKLDHLYQRLDLIGNVEEDDDTDPVGGPKLNIATTTLLGHYATIMRKQKKRFHA